MKLISLLSTNADIIIIKMSKHKIIIQFESKVEINITYSRERLLTYLCGAKHNQDSLDNLSDIWKLVLM
jgi:hypothetical protein